MEACKTMVKNKYTKLTILYFLYFLFATSLAMVAYINSAFLQTIIDVKYVGLVFTLSYLIIFFLIDYFDKVVHSFGARKVMIGLLCLDIVALTTLSFSSHPGIIIPAFITYLVAAILVRITLDIFAESLSSDKETGRIRGRLLTAQNFGWLITPIFAGMLLDRLGFSWMYLIAPCIALPVLIVFLINFKGHVMQPFEKAQMFFHTASRVFKNKAIRNIFCVSLLLNMFYSIMVIYVPLHLLSLGYNWSQIGLIFFVMLIPFVIFQYPAGWLADKVLGEKEMLITGFIICGLSTSALFFVTHPVWWVIALCGTRVGASFIEILSESYFYKHVTAKNINLISFFRRSIPIGFAIGPALASIVLKLNPAIPSVFLMMGIIMILGITFPSMLKDTL